MKDKEAIMKNIFKYIILVTSISSLLNGCASTRWVSDSKPQSAFDSDYSNCKYWAYEKFPPNVGYVARTDYYDVGVYDHYYGGYYGRSWPYRGYYGRPYYRGYPYGYHDYYGPITRVDSEDMNEGARQAAIKSCMIQNGWYQK